MLDVVCILVVLLFLVQILLSGAQSALETPRSSTMQARHIVKTSQFLFEASSRFSGGGCVSRADALWLRRQLQAMGPTYIKIGQFMSTRQDIFDKRIVESLRELRDKVEPVADPRSVIENCVDVESFDWIDWTPLATASIGQVHRGRLRANQKEVVIKVKRPGVAETIQLDTDMWCLALNLLRLTGRNNIQESLDLVTDFRDFITNETDFELEADHMEEFRRRAPEGVIVPAVHRKLSNQSALVMQYVPSERFTDAKRHMTPSECSALAHRLMDLILGQLVNEGVTHGDPHEGNIGVDRSTGSLVMYDLGTVLTVNPELRSQLQQLMFELLVENVDGAIEVMRRMTGVMEVRDEGKLRSYLSRYVHYIRSLDVGVFKGLASDKDAYDVLPVKFESIVFRLIRVLGLLEGICKDLDPAFDYASALGRHLVNRDFLEQRARTDVGRVLLRLVLLVK